MSGGSFTRILAKKLSRIVLCSPPNPGTSQSSNPDLNEDPVVGLVHDHRYAGRRPHSPPLVPVKTKRQRSLNPNCSHSLSCTCVDCLLPSLTPGTANDIFSFASGVQVVKHDDEADGRNGKAEGSQVVERTVSVGTSVSAASLAAAVKWSEMLKAEEETEEVEEAVLSPASSSSSTENRVNGSFTCTICSFQTEKLGEYMGHLESSHAWIGRVKFQCHFCPERFGSYTELLHHSKKYMSQIGAGKTPPAFRPPGSTGSDIARITLH